MVASLRSHSHTRRRRRPVGSTAECLVGNQNGELAITYELNLSGAWRGGTSHRAAGINGFANGVGGQIVQYEKLVGRVMNGRKVNGGVGYNGMRPQILKQRDMIDGHVIYDV